MRPRVLTVKKLGNAAKASSIHFGVRLSVATTRKKFVALLAASVPTSVGDIPAARSNVLHFFFDLE